MRSVTRQIGAAVVLVTAVAVTAWAQDPAIRGSKPPSSIPVQNPSMTPPPPTGVDRAQDQVRREQIKQLDERIQQLRTEYKSAADPIEAQLKSLRDKLASDLQPLQDQRKQLVDEGKSPDLLALDREEADALARLADREKADVEAVHQRYKDQRVSMQGDFTKRRHDLQLAKR